MNRAAYYGLAQNKYISGSGCQCGGMKKACYRWRERGGFLYKIMPCHGCNRALWNQDPDSKQKYIERYHQWVDVSLEAQRAALPPDNPATRNPFWRRLAEQASEPAANSLPEEVNNVQEDLPNS